MMLAARIKSWAKILKREGGALKAAALDPRTPRLARWIALGTLAYALSPVDLIPDFIPVLGQLDDLLLVPLGLWLALRLIPAAVLAEHRQAHAAADKKDCPHILIQPEDSKKS